MTGRLLLACRRPLVETPLLEQVLKEEKAVPLTRTEQQMIEAILAPRPLVGTPSLAGSASSSPVATEPSTPHRHWGQHIDDSARPTTLGEALEIIAAACGLQLDPASTRGHSSKQVAEDISGLTVHTALKVLLTPRNLGYEIKDGVLFLLPVG